MPDRVRNRRPNWVTRLALATCFLAMAAGFLNLANGQKEPTAKVGQESRELDHEKRKLAQQQQTLQKARASLADLQTQLQEQARQASQKTGTLSRQAELDRAKAEADALARLAESERQIAAMEQKAEALRKDILNKKTLFDPGSIFGTAAGGAAPQFIECTGDSIVLIPQGDRIAANQLKVAAAFLKAVTSKYVVFLVRPDGFAAFGAARAVAESKATQLGYEPIDQDWRIKYK